MSTSATGIWTCFIPSSATSPAVQITVSQVGAFYEVKTEVVATPANIVGDLRFLFFNVPDAQEGKLSFWTDQAGTIPLGGVTTGNDNLRAGPLVGFDYQIEIGTPGIGSDDIRSFTFYIGGVSDLHLERFAVRLTSVGVEGGPREGSVWMLCNETATGSITVTKFLDANGDGIIQPTETTTLPGWEFKLYADFNGDGVFAETEFVESQRTGDDGTVTFRPLQLGVAYKVVEVLQGGWYQTVGGDGFTFTPTAAQRDGFFNFANTEYGRITVTKYEDTNGNGKIDEGETTKLSGWTFGIDLNGDGDYDDPGETVTTGEDGTATFTELKIGQSYTVVELGVKDGWYQTVGVGGITVPLTTSGQTGTADFANAQYGKVTVSKWWDKTGDGPSEGDVKIAGWGFQLFVDKNADGDFDDPGEGLFATATTGPDGTATFTGLEVGWAYKVVEESRTGWKPTAPDSGVLTGTIGISGEHDFLDFYNQKMECLEGLTPGFWRQAQNWSKVTMSAEGNAFWLALDDKLERLIDLNKDAKITFAEIFLSGVTLKELFDFSGGLTVRVGKSNTDVAGWTLQRALMLDGGGDLGALVRHGVAGVMNASAEEVNYAFSIEEVIGLFLDGTGKAPGPETAASAKATLEFYNELGLEGSAGFQCLYMTGLSAVQPGSTSVLGFA